MSPKNQLPGIFITLVYLIANMITINDYGYTWDFPHHYNAGIKRLGHITNWNLSWLPNQDRSTFGDQPYGPIADSLPVLSQIMFHYKLNLIPPDAAYHLPLILASSLGLFFLYLLIVNSYTQTTAVLACVFLTLFPRWIGHIHNNPKDTLSAAFFCIAVYFIHKYINRITSTSKREISTSLFHLFFASLASAIAFNMKVNAILLPPVLILWFLLSYRNKLVKNPLFYISHCISYILLSTALSLLIWSIFWPSPLAHLQDLIRHFATGTTNFPIFYYGKIYSANINVPWHYALGYLAAVTPLPLIIFFIIGFLKAVKDTLTLSNPISGLLLAWFLVPTLKYIDPKVGVLDDIRHFLEVVFPLCALGGIGASQIMTAISKKTLLWQFAQPAALFATIMVTYLAYQAYSLHPYQTSYYSQWLGGTKGVAQRNLFDIEFWGNSLKEGAAYLNQVAPADSLIWIPMAQQVAREYLRSDLSITQLPNLKASYLMVFNRYSMLKTTFGIYADIYSLINNQTPILTIVRQNTPILWIFKL